MTGPDGGAANPALPPPDLAPPRAGSAEASGSAIVGATLHAMLVRGDLELPLPGAGSTAARHLALLELARTHPVAVARLAEAHTDAVAILAAAGRTPMPGSLYGVWASERGAPVRLDGRGTISGTKEFCSGVGIVDRALVTVFREGGRPLLVEVDASPARDDIRVSPATWATPALADSATATVSFEAAAAVEGIGPPGWYLDRPGFWHGACGPASCWAGGAIGLVDEAGRLAADAHRDDPHTSAHLGAMRAAAWAMRAMAAAAGDQIDAEPGDVEAAHHRALALRHTVERHCTDVLDRFGRALGPRPFVSDVTVARRHADTHLYLRQHHGERELGELADRPTRPGEAT